MWDIKKIIDQDNQGPLQLEGSFPVVGTTGSKMKKNHSKIR